MAFVPLSRDYIHEYSSLRAVSSLQPVRQHPLNTETKRDQNTGKNVVVTKSERKIEDPLSLFGMI